MSASNIQQMMLPTSLHKQIAAYERVCACVELISQSCQTTTGNADMDQQLINIYQVLKLERDRAWEHLYDQYVKE